MSTHTSSYKQLLNDDGEMVSQIKEIEKSISSRDIYYIPKDEVDNYYDSMQSGDIIATTTNIKGLDVTHTGYIYKDECIAYFMHASIVKKEVTISTNSLKEYLAGNSKQSGIIIARPQEL